MAIKQAVATLDGVSIVNFFSYRNLYVYFLEQDVLDVSWLSDINIAFDEMISKPQTQFETLDSYTKYYKQKYTWAKTSGFGTPDLIIDEFDTPGNETHFITTDRLTLSGTAIYETSSAFDSNHLTIAWRASTAANFDWEIHFRKQDANNYYYLATIFQALRKYRVGKVVSGVNTILDTVTITNVDHSILIENISDQINIYFNGVLDNSYVDTDILTAGKIELQIPAVGNLNNRLKIYGFTITEEPGLTKQVIKSLDGEGTITAKEISVVAWDNFVDTDGTLLENHIADTGEDWEDKKINNTFFDLQVDAVEYNT